MYQIQQSNEYQPGTWKGIKTESGRSASITCPECGKLGSLLDHDIASNGDVQPSLVCPTEGCGFHEFVVLNGWDNG